MRIRRTLHRGVCWFASMVALAALLTACGGGGEDIQPPVTPAASLSGFVIFTADVPLGPPPGDAFEGPVPPDIHFGARVIDPGDDIGGTPVPKPGTMGTNGSYTFDDLETESLVYFNFRFTVEYDLEGNHSFSTPVSFNIPISLLKAFHSHLSCNIDRPSENVLEVTYTYRGPDGSRDIRLRLDFSTDLITFDLDGDGLFDDLIAIDGNHDTIPDEHAPLMQTLDFNGAQQALGTVTSVGSSTVYVAGVPYEIWGSTNLMNSANDAPISLAEVSVGKNADVLFVPYSGRNVAVTLSMQPSPDDPQNVIEVRRDGVIEEITPATIFVGGILFRDYAQAKIEDVLGNTVAPGELEVGEYVTVFGLRDDQGVKATEIIVKDVTPPPAYIERHGTIQALIPEEAPTVMRVTEIDFQLTPQTVIRDLAGKIEDTSSLVVGNPVYVFGHESDGRFVADLIELQYTRSGEPITPEIVVLIDDPSASSDVENAVAQLDTEIAVTMVLIATIDQADPPCIADAFIALFYAKYILDGLPGYLGAFPRVDNDECVVLVLIEDSFTDGYLDTQAWIEYFFPDGIGGGSLPYTPLEFDRVVKPPVYGAGDELIEALEVEDALQGLLESNESVIYIYTSSDVGFAD